MLGRHSISSNNSAKKRRDSASKALEVMKVNTENYVTKYSSSKITKTATPSSTTLAKITPSKRLANAISNFNDKNNENDPLREFMGEIDDISAIKRPRKQTSRLIDEQSHEIR